MKQRSINEKRKRLKKEIKKIRSAFYLELRKQIPRVEVSDKAFSSLLAKTIKYYNSCVVCDECGSVSSNKDIPIRRFIRDIQIKESSIFFGSIMITKYPLAYVKRDDVLEPLYFMPDSFFES